ncbi:hypothetical protein WN943_001112 [Citrus x changshan-huyou]
MGKSCMEKPGDCVTASVRWETLLFEEMLACELEEEKEDQNGNNEVEKTLMITGSNS